MCENDAVHLNPGVSTAFLMSDLIINDADQIEHSPYLSKSMFVLPSCNTSRDAISIPDVILNLNDYVIACVSAGLFVSLLFASL